MLRWGLIIFVIYLLSGVVSKTIGLFLRPIYTTLPQKRLTQDKTNNRPPEEYKSIKDRNMFNVEGTIPEPFDQGLLDCLSQASPSTQRIVLHGTLVTNDDNFSVALIQEEGKPDKIAVKKDDVFFGKYLALKVERKKLCYQVQATQELEHLELQTSRLLEAFNGTRNSSAGATQRAVQD